jgi:hypothetical protein
LLYGLFVINILDLTVRGFWGYHLFLILLYFLPFLAVGLVVGFEYWRLLLGLGLLTSLMNDLFYGFIGNALGWTHYQLKQWMAWQFGFYGTEVKWYFNGGFFKIPVSSLLMGTSIYARIVAVYFLLRGWWKKQGVNKERNPFQ